MRYRFPDNFWWGSACSALQTEGDSLNGGKSQTTWDVWFERQPGRFHQGIGPAETSTFYRHWKQDIALLKQLKHNSFRTSLSWARLIPDGVGEVNPQAVSFYNHVIDELLTSYWRRASRRLLRCSILICRWSCRRKAAGKIATS